MLVRIWCAVVALTDRGRGGGGRSFRPSCAHLTSYPALQHTQQTSYTNLVMLREKNVPQKFKVNFRNLILREWANHVQQRKKQIYTSLTPKFLAKHQLFLMLHKVVLRCVLFLGPCQWGVTLINSFYKVESPRGSALLKLFHASKSFQLDGILHLFQTNFKVNLTAMLVVPAVKFSAWRQKMVAVAL